MSLVSPGVEVTIIDESQYSSAAQNTVPYILMATAENKLTPAGTGIAPGTLASALGDVYLITSQRELVNTFGNPTFYKTSGGDALHGYELNEYGLMAAYSVLGATNRAYIQRVDVDMSQLEASLLRPVGASDDGTYWFDLVDSEYGLFAWDLTTNAFTNVSPLVITATADLNGNVPLNSIGTIGSYAINVTSDENHVSWKNSSNAWVLLGHDLWMNSNVTLLGSIASPTFIATDTIVINGAAPITVGADISALVSAINTAAVAGVTAVDESGKLALYTDSGTLSDVDGYHLTIADGTGSPLALLGITAGTYYSPVVVHDNHIDIPRWRSTDTIPRPAGSIWVKTTSVNDGMDVVIKRYDSVTDTFVVQSAPAYANDQTANQFLDPATGGSSIAAGDTYVQYDVNENDRATFTLFGRTAGVTSITGNVVGPAVSQNDTFTIQASATNSDVMSAIETITLNAAVPVNADIAEEINAANIPNVEASVTSSGFLNITHTGGGVISLVDTDSVMLLSGITASLDNVRDGVATFELILSNWNLLTYTADIVEPGQDPLDGTRWYYSAIDEIDILIHDSNVWKSYRTVTNDTRGYNLVDTDPAGPIISATTPEFQADGTTAVVDGDLWIDSSDLENYPVIRRRETDFNSVESWVLIDNADQTSTNGVLFADARWGADNTVDVITGDMSTISELLLVDTSASPLDPDAPDDTLYPDGMLLWNTRRSGYNVKEFRNNYFNASDFDLTNFPSIDSDTWVTVSGKRDDGSANFGRLAQRALVVQAMKAAIDTNSDIREEQRQYNLMAVPGYPELIPNMVALNNERSNTSFIVGDSPLRLENTGTEITKWASNNDGLGLVTNDGLASNDEYLGVFYPSGRTNDLAGTSIVVPPSHMILRTIIHSDEQSYPWLAPAGTRRGQVDNVDAIGYVDAVTGEFQQMSTRQGIRDVLYTNNVNPITFIPGAGIVNYGNKTTKEGSALDRINVSRLVSYIRVQADALGKLFVFEPNDKLTRDEIKGQMERMLNDLVAKRGLYDYVVVCDRSNNTNVRIDRNELWVDIAVEPVKAGEFIYVPIRIQNTGDISGG